MGCCKSSHYGLVCGDINVLFEVFGLPLLVTHCSLPKLATQQESLGTRSFSYLVVVFGC